MKVWLAILVASLSFIPAVSAGTATPSGYSHPAIAICQVFGPRYCVEALEVSWCESRFDTNASNGQYRGLFQMGSWERRTFGHGSNAWSQARAAKRYFVRTGRDWSPWSCKP